MKLQGLNDILVPWQNWNVDSPTFLTDGSEWLLKDTVDYNSGCNVETILYADELPQGMQWTADEQKCREAGSSSNIVGNTVNDEYVVIYEEYTKCDPVADASNPLCQSYPFALNAKYKKVPHVLYHVRCWHIGCCQLFQLALYPAYSLYARLSVCRSYGLQARTVCLDMWFVLAI